MKFLCSLLAIMIVVLSCLPCNDARAVVVPAYEHSITTAATDNAAPSGNEHKDYCSPFCLCSCCSAAYALPLTGLPALKARPEVTAKVFASYLQRRPVGIALPVWQPPQLV